MKTWKKVLILLSAIVVVGIASFISWSYGFRAEKSEARARKIRPGQ